MLFPLSKDCSTVGASSLPQCKAAEEPKRKQDDGQEDAQAGEAVFQDTNPADWAASDHDDGVGRIPGDRSTVDVVDPGVAGGDPCDEVGVGRRRGRGGDGPVAVRAARVVALTGLQVVGGRALLQQGLVVHRGPRRRAPASSGPAPFLWPGGDGGGGGDGGVPGSSAQ